MVSCTRSKEEFYELKLVKFSILVQLETAAPKVEEVAVEEEVVVDDLSMLSTKELRALCKERDLDSSGKKSALIARLESDE